MIPDGYSIRPLRLEDAASLAAAYDRNREHLARWDPARDEAFYTEAGQRRQVEQALASVAAGSLDTHVIVHGDVVVGCVTLAHIVRTVVQSGVLGYWTDHEHLRRGLARAATAYAVERGRALGLHRLEAGTRLENLASQRVLEAGGFEEYGVARGFLYTAGAWRDMRLFQLILNDEPPPAG